MARGTQVVRTARHTTRAGRTAGAVGRAAAKACNSFSADTPVATKDGSKPIRTVQVGDQVLAYNETLGTTGSYTVTNVISHIDPVIVQLTIDNELIETTPEHPFYTREQGWTPAGELWIGAQVRRVDGTYRKVEAVAVVAQTQRMYNLSVAEAPTFFAGDKQWLVHNAKCIIDIKDPGKILRPKGFVENPNRAGSWGKYDYQKKGRTTYREYWRYDEPELGKPGWRGKDHVHHYELEDHLDPSTPFDPDAPYSGNKK